jgi:hypothetical protein
LLPISSQTLIFFFSRRRILQGPAFRHQYHKLKKRKGGREGWRKGEERTEGEEEREFFLSPSRCAFYQSTKFPRANKNYFLEISSEKIGAVILIFISLFFITHRIYRTHLGTVYSLEPPNAYLFHAP